jgi:hypothetical protein
MDSCFLLIFVLRIIFSYLSKSEKMRHDALSCHLLTEVSSVIFHFFFFFYGEGRNCNASFGDSFSFDGKEKERQELFLFL